MRRCPKPIIAMIAGYAVGGGHILHMVRPRVFRPRVSASQLHQPSRSDCNSIIWCIMPEGLAIPTLDSISCHHLCFLLPQTVALTILNLAGLRPLHRCGQCHVWSDWTQGANPCHVRLLGGTASMPGSLPPAACRLPEAKFASDNCCLDSLQTGWEL